LVKHTKHTHQDDPLFRREMADVVPLKTRPTTESRPPRKPPAGRRPAELPAATEALPPALSHAAGHRTSADGSSHRKNGIQNRTLQRLKRGRFRVAAELDLHSMTLETARAVLLDFIAASQANSMEAVRIIHGKGLRSENGPRLKQMTLQVLRDHPLVRAYAGCKPADGGSGAVDVLLRKS